jgi:hypothetical protein
MLVGELDAKEHVITHQRLAWHAAERILAKCKKTKKPEYAKRQRSQNQYSYFARVLRLVLRLNPASCAARHAKKHKSELLRKGSQKYQNTFRTSYQAYLLPCTFVPQPARHVPKSGQAIEYA